MHDKFLTFIIISNLELNVLLTRSFQHIRENINFTELYKRIMFKVILCCANETFTGHIYIVVNKLEHSL